MAEQACVGEKADTVYLGSLPELSWSQRGTGITSLTLIACLLRSLLHTELRRYPPGFVQLKLRDLLLDQHQRYNCPRILANSSFRRPERRWTRRTNRRNPNSRDAPRQSTTQPKVVIMVSTTFIASPKPFMKLMVVVSGACASVRIPLLSYSAQKITMKQLATQGFAPAELYTGPWANVCETCAGLFRRCY